MSKTQRQEKQKPELKTRSRPKKTPSKLIICNKKKRKRNVPFIRMIYVTMASYSLTLLLNTVLRLPTEQFDLAEM